MDNKEKKKLKGVYILKGIRNVLICDGIAAIFLIIIAVVFALIKNASIIKSIYMSFYYGGALALLVAVPQFYKKNRNPKPGESRGSIPLFGFFSRSNSDSSTQESWEDFIVNGFWLGIMITISGTILLALAVILENIFFVAPK